MPLSSAMAAPTLSMIRLPCLRGRGSSRQIAIVTGSYAETAGASIATESGRRRGTREARGAQAGSTKLCRHGSLHEVPQDRAVRLGSFPVMIVEEIWFFVEACCCRPIQLGWI